MTRAQAALRNTAIVNLYKRGLPCKAIAMLQRVSLWVVYRAVKPLRKKLDKRKR